MKKLFFIGLMILSSLFVCSCGGSDDNNDNGFSETPVTESQLESGTGTFEMIKGSRTYYLCFNNGSLMYGIYKNSSFTDLTSASYSISGDSIFMVKNLYDGSKQKYSAFIEMVNWGYDKTSSTGTGGTQLLIRGENLPYSMETGYYDKSVVSLK